LVRRSFVKFVISHLKQQKPIQPNERWLHSASHLDWSFCRNGKRSTSQTSEIPLQPTLPRSYSPPGLGSHPDDTTRIARPSYYNGRWYSSVVVIIGSSIKRVMRSRWQGLKIDALGIARDLLVENAQRLNGKVHLRVSALNIDVD